MGVEGAKGEDEEPKEGRGEGGESEEREEGKEGEGTLPQWHPGAKYKVLLARGRFHFLL